jgi:purine-nucleoside phosphorylase
MISQRQQVKETAAFLVKQTVELPRIGLMTGTGLSGSAATMARSHTFAYSALPHFPLSTVESHAGRLVFGRMARKPVVMMQGRIHLYEGYSPPQVTFPIRVMQEIGVTHLIVTNAAGGLNPALHPGDIMVISDHLNLTGENPLVGPNVDEWGVRFPDMSRAYAPEMAEMARQGGQQNGVSIQTGVYAGLKGPSLETPAEIRYLKTIGADAVGFSTVQEVIAAVHAGMRILGLSTITNVHDPDNPAPATLDEIIAVAETAVPRLDAVMAHVIEQLEVP